MKEIIVFYRNDVIHINDVIDFKSYLRQQILINYTSFKSPYQNKANDASNKFLCGILAEMWANKHFYT